MSKPKLIHINSASIKRNMMARNYNEPVFELGHLGDGRWEVKLAHKVELCLGNTVVATLHYSKNPPTYIGAHVWIETAEDCIILVDGEEYE